MVPKPMLPDYIPNFHLMYYVTIIETVLSGRFLETSTMDGSDIAKLQLISVVVIHFDLFYT